MGHIRSLLYLGERALSESALVRTSGVLSIRSNSPCSFLAACAADSFRVRTACTASQYARDTSGYIFPGCRDGRKAIPLRKIAEMRSQCGLFARTSGSSYSSEIVGASLVLRSLLTC